jgi:uncharacterized protein (DUF433 family)
MTTSKRLVREMHGGEPYEYYPLGKHVVAAPGVCGGRPTFKYTRLEVRAILDLMAAGETVEDIIRTYPQSRLTVPAIREAARLAGDALARAAKTLPAAV